MGYRYINQMRLFCILDFILLLLISCSSSHSPSQSISTKIEKQYRPGGEKPSLPTLKLDSPLSDFITYALLNNPNVESTFYDWEQAINKVVSAGSLPQPQLTLSAEIDRVLTKSIIGFMQGIPAPGTLALQAEAASAEAQKKRYLFEEELLKTALKVKQTYYKSILLNEKIRITKEMSLLADTQELSNRTQLKTGLNNTESLVMIQSEQKQLQNELINLTDSLNVLTTNWRADLGIKPKDETIIPLPNTTLPENILPPETDLLNEALEHNVKLKELSAEIKQAETLVKSAYQERKPDFNVGLSADTKKDPWSLMPELNLTLPIRRKKIAADIAAARTGSKQAQAMRSAEEINLAVLVAEESFIWRQLMRQSQLLREKLIPLAELRVNNLDFYYRSNKVDLTDLLNARRALLELQFKLTESNIQREIVFAEISLVVISHWPEEISKILLPE